MNVKIATIMIFVNISARILWDHLSANANLATQKLQTKLVALVSTILPIPSIYWTAGIPLVGF